MLDSIDLDTALEFYRDRFADAGDFTFTLVGAFELDDLVPLVERYLASLPATGRDETWRDVGIEPPTGVVQRTVHKGLEPKGRQTLLFTGDFDFKRENRYTLQSMTEVLRNMLRESLREDLGGTYGVGAFGSGSREPRERYSVRIAFGADPERLGELTDAAFAAIDSLSEHGASEENLAKVKETQRRQRETDLKENSFWMSVLNVYDRNEEDLRLILDYDRLVEGLTAEAIGEAPHRRRREGAGPLSARAGLHACLFGSVTRRRPLLGDGPSPSRPAPARRERGRRLHRDGDRSVRDGEDHGRL